MTLKVTPHLLPLLSLMLTLAGCGTLADRREVRQTAQALPAVSATLAVAAPSDSAGASPTRPATEPAAATETVTEPAPAVEPAATTGAPTATPNPPADTAGEELLALLDQLDADLKGEDGGVERDLP